MCNTEWQEHFWRHAMNACMQSFVVDNELFMSCDEHVFFCCNMACDLKNNCDMQLQCRQHMKSQIISQTFTKSSQERV